MMSRSAWSSVTWLATVLALAGCGDSPSAPGRTVTSSLSTDAGAVVSRSRTQESSTGDVTTCGAETVTMTIVMDSQNHTTTLASGEWMLTQHIRISAEGVGTTSGARHIRRGTFNKTQVFAALPEGGASTLTQVFRIRDIVQGSADNESSLVVHAKWTINSNGQLSVDLFNFEFDCRG